MAGSLWSMSPSQQKLSEVSSSFLAVILLSMEESVPLHSVSHESMTKQWHSPAVRTPLEIKPHHSFKLLREWIGCIGQRVIHSAGYKNSLPPVVKFQDKYIVLSSCDNIPFELLNGKAFFWSPEQGESLLSEIHSDSNTCSTVVVLEFVFFVSFSKDKSKYHYQCLFSKPQAYFW